MGALVGVSLLSVGTMVLLATLFWVAQGAPWAGAPAWAIFHLLPSVATVPIASSFFQGLRNRGYFLWLWIAVAALALVYLYVLFTVLSG